MIGSSDPEKLAEFYERVFEREPDMKENGFFGWLVKTAFISIGKHSEVAEQAKEPQRIIFNFESEDVEAEFNRIKALGAEVIKEPYDVGNNHIIATFADPDGNYFQLMPPWEGK